MNHRLALAVAFAVTAAPVVARAAEPTLRVDLGGGTALDLVLVPAGRFTQGSPAAEKGREPDESVRDVEITHPFYTGKYPVTVGQFTRFTSATGYRTEAEKGTSGGFGWDGKALVQRREFTWKNPGFPQTDAHPVTIVTYDDANAFTQWLSRVAGRKVSLPTEAQWEHAYRAGTKSAYPGAASEKEALDLGWFKENALTGTHPVGQKKPNAWSLYDMAGNVHQWCADWYAPYPAGPAQDPLATQPDGSDKARRVLRGASWLKEVKHGRAAARYRNAPGSRNADNGFRVVASVDVSAAPAAAIPTNPTPPPPAAPASSPSTPSTSAQRNDQTAFGLGCMGALLVMGTGLLVFLLRRAPPGGKDVSFRTGPDGFWIDAPKHLAGATLHYRHRGVTGPHEGNVVLEASDVGQFVYTGAPPRHLSIVRILRPQRHARTSGPSRQSHQRHHHTHDEHHHHHHHRHDDDDRFRGYPSAY
ncbi:Hypothetical protein A7982_00937 [Minicystis rosea]|nr:Hypothetical protein A7982_00937 [Minicystis rosea]